MNKIEEEKQKVFRVEKPKPNNYSTTSLGFDVKSNESCSIGEGCESINQNLIDECVVRHTCTSLLNYTEDPLA